MSSSKTESETLTNSSKNIILDLINPVY